MPWARQRGELRPKAARAAGRTAQAEREEQQGWRGGRGGWSQAAAAGCAEQLDLHDSTQHCHRILLHSKQMLVHLRPLP